MLKKGVIRQIRKAKGLSIGKAAKISEMEKSTWLKIEQGKRNNITLNTLDRVAFAIEEKPGDLLE